MKILTGVAIINDTVGKRISYTYTVVDENGTVVENNKKESFVVLDEDTKQAVGTLETLVEARMNK